MVMKRYICGRYPRLRILGGIQFVDGRFDTDNPLIQQRIEKNDLFNGAIRCVELSVVEEAVKEVDETKTIAPIPPPPSFDVDFGLEEDDGSWDDQEVGSESEGGESPPVLSRTEIGKLNRQALSVYAAELGIEDIESKNMIKLRYEVHQKLGI
jgi:hypothetical protein